MFGNNGYPGNLLPTYSLRSTATVCAAGLDRARMTASVPTLMKLGSSVAAGPRWVSFRIPSEESFFVTFVPSWFNTKVTLMFGASAASSLMNYAC